MISKIRKQQRHGLLPLVIFNGVKRIVEMIECVWVDLPMITCLNH